MEREREQVLKLQLIQFNIYTNTGICYYEQKLPAWVQIIKEQSSESTVHENLPIHCTVD